MISISAKFMRTNLQEKTWSNIYTVGNKGHTMIRACRQMVWLSKLKWEIKSYVPKNYVMQRATNNLLLIMNVFYARGMLHFPETSSSCNSGLSGTCVINTSWTTMASQHSFQGKTLSTFASWAHRHSTFRPSFSRLIPLFPQSWISLNLFSPYTCICLIHVSKGKK